MMPTTDLSVALIVPEHRETVLRTLQYLQRQTVCHRLEVILLGASAALLETLRDELRPFGTCQLVVWERMRNMAAARAHAVRIARSPLAVHAEDHCFPEPGWAEALIRAFAPSADGTVPAAAGPLMVNENPRTLWSWAAFTLHFSHCAFRESHGPAQFLATHNTCFRRDALVALGEHLDSGIEMELLLQNRLRANGHTMTHQTEAVTRHVNVSRPSALLTSSFFGGWLFSTVRMREEQWTLGRKVFQLAASPLVPLLQLKRRWPALRRIAPGRSLLPWVIPHVLLIAAVHTVGEVTGIVFPRDQVIENYSNFENTRTRFVRLDELPLLEPDAPQGASGLR
jgi:hypothetical protein